ncbi:serine/arginine-rich splicing factor 3a isoform X1 [Epinephelus moara]|uniref:serine/arginine-rich splicing factor 3a isoform X1 n=1 Tax=Epinephelus moara TaxID=300413 RepID=UPI00214E91A2|nr:serine/arginine-rich splicing factor 3a isoform X1 [Epinephelus moara]
MQFPASSSSSSNFNPIDSGPLHIINQSASLLSLFSTQLLYQREQPLAYIPSHPSPQKGRENLQLPLPTSHQATSYLQHLHHVANPLGNSTSLTISLASLRHFYLVQIPPNRGEAAVAAGLFQETEADSGLSPETRNAKDPSHGQGVVPVLTRENEDLRQWFICRISPWLGGKTIFYSHVFFSRGMAELHIV